jgi:protein-L-isoaspartate(D-aspartate) O-methyltransferase
MESRQAQRLRREVARSGVRDARVLDAIAAVPRERFVPVECREFAYDNAALPIGYRQTISQPTVVALMTEALAIEPGMRVLEIGTGSGYQAAVLAWLGAEVWSVEIVGPLAERAAEVLADLGLDRVHVRASDGNLGWPEQAPFDRIIATAAAKRIPPTLLAQLAPDGILVMPLEEPDGEQNLVKVTRGPDGLAVEPFCAVRFVPFVGGEDGGQDGGQDNG